MKKLFLALVLLTAPAVAQDIQNPRLGANPSATIGAAAVNGSAQTFMRSDAAPALPATLPALNGSALTNLNGSAIASGTVPAANGGAGAINGALKANGSGVVTQANCASLSDAGSGCSATGANPTATIGASAVNGSAATFMRSDGAPALPATLPALNGSALTNLNAGNVATGTLAVARGGTGIGTWSSFRIVRATSSQTGVASNTPTTVAFNSATYDTASLCNTSTGVCTVNTAGTWHFDTSVAMSGTLSTAALATTAFYKNGTLYSTCYGGVVTITAAPLACSADIVMAASDTIQVKSAATTSAGTVTFGQPGTDTWFNGHWSAP